MCFWQDEEIDSKIFLLWKTNLKEVWTLTMMANDYFIFGKRKKKKKKIGFENHLKSYLKRKIFLCVNCPFSPFSSVNGSLATISIPSPVVVFSLENFATVYNWAILYSSRVNGIGVLNMKKKKNAINFRRFAQIGKKKNCEMQNIIIIKQLLTYILWWSFSANSIKPLFHNALNFFLFEKKKTTTMQEVTHQPWTTVSYWFLFFELNWFFIFFFYSLNLHFHLTHPNILKNWKWKSKWFWFLILIDCFKISFWIRFNSSNDGLNFFFQHALKKKKLVSYWKFKSQNDQTHSIDSKFHFIFMDASNLI